MADKTPPVFIDTNILIYAYSNTEGDKQKEVRQILGLKNSVISTQVVNEFIWVMNKKYYVSNDIIETIVKNLFKVYHVGIIDKNIILKAMEISEKAQYSYWDSLMLASALSNNCKILYSEDMQSGQKIEEKLIIINPFKK